MINQTIMMRNWGALLFLHMTLPFTADAQTEEFGRSLKIEYHQVTTRPLPFQAVRLQTVWRNVSDKPVSLEILPERTFRIVSVDPADAEPSRTPIRHNVYWPRETTAVTQLDFRDTKKPTFNPGEELSASIAFSAEWKGRKAIRQFFTKDGNYTVRVHVYSWKSPPIRITIHKPEGDEFEVYKMLRDENALAAAMMCPTYPPNSDVIPKIRHIAKRYPKSSYADYAHFALGRRIFKGRIDTPTHQLKKLPLGRRKDAIEHLKKIDFKRFAYAPLAMRMLRTLLLSKNSPEAITIVKRLDIEYEDSFFRLLDLAYRLSRKEWETLDPRKPRKPNKMGVIRSSP